MNPETLQRFDRCCTEILALPKVNPYSGYLTCEGISAREGVLIYRLTDGSIRRELRLAEDIFHPDSLASMQGKPFIHEDAHVTMYTSSNISPYVRGSATSSYAVEDEKCIKTRIDIYDAEMIEQIQNKKITELSWAYDIDHIEWTSGVWNGQEYDCIQRGPFISNHLAGVETGRGEDLCIRLDSALVSVETSALPLPASITPSIAHPESTIASGSPEPSQPSPPIHQDDTTERLDGWAHRGISAMIGFVIEENGVWYVRHTWNYDLLSEHATEEEALAARAALTEINADEVNALSIQNYKEWRSWQSRLDSSKHALEQATGELAQAKSERALSQEEAGTLRTRLDSAEGKIVGLEEQAALADESKVQERIKAEVESQFKTRLDAAQSVSGYMPEESIAGLLALTPEAMYRKAAEACLPEDKREEYSSRLDSKGFCQGLLASHGMHVAQSDSATFSSLPPVVVPSSRLDSASEKPAQAWLEKHNNRYANC